MVVIFRKNGSMPWIYQANELTIKKFSKLIKKGYEPEYIHVKY